MAGRYNSTILQGSDWIRDLQIQGTSGPIDLTGYTARMQVREKLEDVTFLVELTTENGGITFPDPVAGEIQLHITSAQTELFDYEGNAVYDLELIDSGGVVQRLIEGTLGLSREVTR